MMTARIAFESDAEAACGVLRRSIRELCMADHRGDASILDVWLGNKTPENVRVWMTAPGSHFVIAEQSGQIVGVGAAIASGEITLNYVDPNARFQGISKAILSSLEEYLADRGQVVFSLTSTQTAHRFYQALGYHDAGAMTVWAGMMEQPMVKDVSRKSYDLLHHKF